MLTVNILILILYYMRILMLIYSYRKLFDDNIFRRLVLVRSPAIRGTAVTCILFEYGEHLYEHLY